mmetsp:Transcript_37699/g.33713  ORF Transcript_37699/g.33713 Transcript_37699/m.33713 type:complete len:174 (+) Transcript_37699:585-1106(+)
MAHLDLKLDNLMLDEDYNLKVIDFDLSYTKDHESIRGRGTANYRAPELRFKNTQKRALDPKRCDIFSMGVILFILKSGGVLPFKETEAGNPFFEDFSVSEKLFWMAHRRLKNRDMEFFSEEFMELFEGMCAKDPRKRLSIDDVLESEWAQGDVYNGKELKEVMDKFFKNSKRE